jgi:signal transduction histidine kinase
MQPWRPKLREDHATIQRQAQRAGTSIQEFLELSRASRKVLARVDINRLVDRAVLLSGQQMRKSALSTYKSH